MSLLLNHFENLHFHAGLIQLLILEGPNEIIYLEGNDWVGLL